MIPTSVSKEFLDKCKKYLVTISSSRAQYCYFNFCKNTVILCNSTSGGKGQAHGDRLMDFTVGELALHFVSFKDLAFFKQLREFLLVPEIDFYCVHIVNLMSLVNTIGKEDIDVIKVDGYTVFKRIAEPILTDKNKVGFTVTDFHVIRALLTWTKHIRTVVKREDLVETAVNVNVTSDNGLYFTELNIEQLHLDRYYKNVEPTIKFLAFDGLTTVSLKSFIKKLKNATYQMKRFVWVENNLIYSYATFEDSFVKVLSYRPNIASLPLIKDVVIVSKKEK
jgi:hypothetical protein